MQKKKTQKQRGKFRRKSQSDIEHKTEFYYFHKKSLGSGHALKSFNHFQDLCKIKKINNVTVYICILKTSIIDTKLNTALA